jgi:two-component system sensor kinase FixL
MDSTTGNLGTIISVNPYASKLFGHTKWQLERRNINIIMPSPLAEMHDGFLQRYLQTGKGCVVDSTRVVFGLHRNGHIFTMLLAVREVRVSLSKCSSE